MKVIVIQGLKSGVGASFVAANVAYRLSMTNVRVLVVNARSSHYPLESYFNLPSDLTDGWMSSSEASLLDCRYRYNDLLDILPSGLEGSENDGQRRVRTLIAQARREYDFCVVDAGVIDSDWAKAYADSADLTIDVMEPEAGCLMRLVHRNRFSDNEYLMFNKVWPMSRTHSDVSTLIRRHQAFADRLITHSVPYDEYALQSSLYKQPITQTMLFTQSAEQLNHLTTWIKQQLLT